MQPQDWLTLRNGALTIALAFGLLGLIVVPKDHTVDDSVCSVPFGSACAAEKGAWARVLDVLDGIAMGAVLVAAAVFFLALGCHLAGRKPTDRPRGLDASTPV